ncbi:MULTISPECIES: bifunctional 2-polyprenyl-6-hydroxyphenol methylase/3-demethylubiquinol 3-O-methyltransferase UbiG [unclassified Acidovorax]|uniref:class I SAM-dependent methyltransferase n=1 Tax=unclassified Acidovorax TaxID=2684926 RepID=UPI001C47285D|nr:MULTISPECIES: class I SAM-dependent methyltransferase [unclassified Acidovorax]MBV7431502.1 class I SAM-dependent methyltransferase [Acidovorax sp. sif0732]MBV7452719.1 class I SAM-dependent methyltransferase [Acidovorax sp. sif0715]
MDTLPIPGTAGYGTHAAALAAQYESIAFADVHRSTLHLFPRTPSRVLDIGAGSGRDAAALVRAGHHVVAAEPTAALRQEGQRIHAGLTIEWVDDHLPALTGLRGRQFDLVLLTAVWMHLDAAERAAAMRAVADLPAPGALVVMSLRHGPVPRGRRMFDVSMQETAALGARHGLHTTHSGTRDDAQGRPDVRWSVLALRRPV